MQKNSEEKARVLLQFHLREQHTSSPKLLRVLVVGKHNSVHFQKLLAARKPKAQDDISDRITQPNLK